MAGLAIKKTDRSVSDFINNIENVTKREDSKTLLSLIRETTGFEPVVWGVDTYIGFGDFKYTRKGGKEEFEWFRIGFAPGKAKMTIHLLFDISKYPELLNNLGKCTWGKGCLYINKVSDIDLDVLKQLIGKSKEAKW